MKFIPLFPLGLLAGCSTATTTTPTLPPPQIPADIRSVAAPVQPATPPLGAALEKRLTQQAQLIEALLSQNDALTARVNLPPATPAEAPKPEIVKPATELPRATTPPPLAKPSALPLPVEVATLAMPNTDGVVDLTIADAADTDAANPFVVRRAASDPVREVTLLVAGIIMGRTPSALINDRLMQAGDVIENLTIERIESDAVVLRHQNHLLKLPIAEKPARVRLSL